MKWKRFIFFRFTGERYIWAGQMFLMMRNSPEYSYLFVQADELIMESAELTFDMLIGICQNLCGD